MLDCEQSFSSDFKAVRGVHARASVERREKRGQQPGHLRVSGVLLDGPREKRHCS